MTIAINITNGQTRWGPGTAFFWDIPSPVTPPAGPYTISFRLLSVEGGGIWFLNLTRQSVPVSGFQTIAMNEDSTLTTGLDLQVPVVDEADTRLFVEIRDDAGNIFDTGQRDLKWNTTMGLSNLIAHGSTGAGLTPTERAQLQQSSEGGIAGFFDSLGRLVNFPWADYVAGQPPPQFLSRKAETFPLIGEFDLTVPLWTYGLIWTWTLIPIGIGRRPGLPIIYHGELLTLTEIHLDRDANEFAVNRVISQTEGIPYTFVQPQPTRLHVQVLPGVQGVGQWLQLPT